METIRRWVSRGTLFWTPLLAIVLALFVVAFQVVPTRVDDGAFQVSLEPKSNNVEVVSADSGTVLLTGNDAGKHGLLGLRWAGGRALLGPVISTSDEGALRCVLPDAHGEIALPPSGPARVASEAYFVAPAEDGDASGVASVRGIALEEVMVDAGGVRRPAYRAGGGDDWVVLVHGKGGTREEGMRVAPALLDLGMTVLSISYRDDPESISGPRPEYDYGRSEWPDLAAAVEYARGEGARRVVLFGYSMGGGVVANYLLQTAEAGGTLLDAVVLDAPMLDLRATVEHGIAGSRALSWFAGPLTWTTEFRLQQDFGAAAYVEGLTRLATSQEMPTLIFHQRGDHLVPTATSEDAADGSSAIELVTFDQPGHTRAWNDDPKRYEEELTGFLQRELDTVQGPLVSEQTQAVLDAPCGDRTVGEIIEEASTAAR